MSVVENMRGPEGMGVGQDSAINGMARGSLNETGSWINDFLYYF